MKEHGVDAEAEKIREKLNEDENKREEINPVSCCSTSGRFPFCLFPQSEKDPDSDKSKLVKFEEGGGGSGNLWFLTPILLPFQWSPKRHLSFVCLRRLIYFRKAVPMKLACRILSPKIISFRECVSPSNLRLFVLL